MAHSGDIQRSVYELWWAVSGPHFPQSHTHSLLHRLWLQGLGDGSKGRVYLGASPLSAEQKARVVELVEQILANCPELQVRCDSRSGGLSCCSNAHTALTHTQLCCVHCGSVCMACVGCNKSMHWNAHVCVRHCCASASACARRMNWTRRAIYTSTSTGWKRMMGVQRS